EVGSVAEAEQPAEATHDVPADAHDGEEQHADRHGLGRGVQEHRQRDEHDRQHGCDDEVPAPGQLRQARARCRLDGLGGHQLDLPKRPCGRSRRTRTKKMNTVSSGLWPGSSSAPSCSARPTTSPPSSAPTTLPIPPSTTTTNAMMLNNAPVTGSIVTSGATSTPAAPAQAVPIAKVIM